MIKGLIVGGIVACTGILVLCAYGHIVWIGLPVAIGLFGGLIVGMMVKK